MSFPTQSSFYPSLLRDPSFSSVIPDERSEDQESASCCFGAGKADYNAMLKLSQIPNNQKLQIPACAGMTVWREGESEDKGSFLRESHFLLSFLTSAAEIRNLSVSALKRERRRRITSDLV